jgi:hypothetical protein
MDPMQIRLNDALYHERLAAAEQARRRASWVRAPRLIERLRLAIVKRLSVVGKRRTHPLDRRRTSRSPS